LPSTAPPLERPMSATCRAVCHLGDCKKGDPRTDTVSIKLTAPAEALAEAPAEEVGHPEPPLPPPEVYDWWAIPLDEATEDEVVAERLQRQWELDSQWDAEQQRRQKIEARQQFIEEQRQRREAERVRREAEAWERQQRAEAEAAEAKRAEEARRIQQERVRVAEAYRKQEEDRMEKARMRRLTIDSFLREHGFTEHVNVPKRTLMTTKYPLHTAAKLGDAELVEMLIEERADPTLCDSRGLTPMQTAERHSNDGSHEAVLQVLRAHIGEPVDGPAEGNVREVSHLGPTQRALEVISGASQKAGVLPTMRLRMPVQANAMVVTRSRPPTQVGDFGEMSPQEDNMSVQSSTPRFAWKTFSLRSRVGQARSAHHLEMRSGLLGNFGQRSPQAPLSAELPMPRIVACG